MTLDAAIVGVAFSQVSRHSDKTVGQLALEACAAAVADAGLELSDVDGIATYPRIGGPIADPVDGVDFVGVEYMAAQLAPPNLRWSCSLTRAVVVGAAAEAANAVSSGACDVALVWRAMHNPPGKYGYVAGGTVSGEDQFSRPWGFGQQIVQFSLPYSQYMAKYGAKRTDMAPVIVRNRQNASINPNAVFFGQPITADDYLNARMVADPLSLLDCDMPVDGCGALVITRADRARQLRQPPAYIRGHAHLGLSPRRFHFFSLPDLQGAAAQLARALYTNSRVSRGDLESLFLYDGFSYFPYIYLEEFGFCAEGEGYQALQDDRFALGGALPVNTSGGNLGMGRLHGTPQLLEAVLQIQRRAGRRQIANSDITLVTAGAPHLGASAMVLSSTPE